MLANVVLALFIHDGPIMWPVPAAFPAAAAAVVLERSLWWFGLRRRSDTRILEAAFAGSRASDFARATELTVGSGDPHLRTVHDRLPNAHSSLLGEMELRASDELEGGERFHWVLGTLTTLAPLIGLLGTITGIMQSLSFVGNEHLAATKVSGGIPEALIATAAGLRIAILCLLPFNLLNRRLAHFRSRLERTINHVELLVESAKHHGHDLEAFARSRALNATAADQSADAAPAVPVARR